MQIFFIFVAFFWKLDENMEKTWHFRKLDESPRWRLQHGYIPEAEHTLQKFMRAQQSWKTDSKKLDEDLRTLIKRMSVGDKDDSPSKHFGETRIAIHDNGKIRYTYRHLFISPSLRNFTLVVALTQ